MRDTYRREQRAGVSELLEHGRHSLILEDPEDAAELAGHNTGEHVFHKALVPRHVHDAQLDVLGQVEERKPQIDGDTALLFLLQTVGIDVGEGFDKTGLAMINVTGGA